MSGNFSDAHCHLADSVCSSAERVRDTLRDCAASGIRLMMMGGVDPEDWARQSALIDLAAELGLPNLPPIKIITSYGLHPWAVNKLSGIECDAKLKILVGIVEQGKDFRRPMAVGECGLDFAHRLSKEQKNLQISAFRKQCEIAREARLPIVVHSVGAFDTTFEIIAENAANLVGVMLHGFSGDKGQIARYLKLGPAGWVRFSIGPAKKRRHDELALRAIPPKALLIESDSHDDPRVVLDVAREVAGIRGEDAKVLHERSTENLLDFLGL